ncbi:MAG: hypothetical protein KF770_06035 [Anaerolineae bacterium]|nr:hypothetical protein [Anaerolineae bacterium]
MPENSGLANGRDPPPFPILHHKKAPGTRPCAWRKIKPLSFFSLLTSYSPAVSTMGK